MGHELEDADEFVAGEIGDLVIGADDLLEEAFFALNHVVDVLFDGVLGDELEDLDAAVLPDPVDSVGGLVFLGGVPPAVIVDDDGGDGEVDADAGGEEGGDKDFAAGVFAEPAELIAPITGGAFDGGKSDPFFLQVRFDDGDHLEVLGKDDDFLAAFARFLEEFDEEVPLA